MRCLTKSRSKSAVDNPRPSWQGHCPYVGSHKLYVLVAQFRTNREILPPNIAKGLERVTWKKKSEGRREVKGIDAQRWSLVIQLKANKKKKEEKRQPRNEGSFRFSSSPQLFFFRRSSLIVIAMVSIVVGPGPHLFV